MRVLGLLTLALSVLADKKSPQSASPSPSGAGKRVVCYYTNWSVYRPGGAKFTPQNINPYLCTHLIYAFGGLTRENGLRPFDKYQDIEQGGYAKFTGLKTYNKELKTMLAIGGWNEGSARFSPMVADAGRRRELVRNAVRFLRQNHFDGLDLDWEYPAFRDGGKPRDKDNYAQLVKELREEFDREADKTGRPQLLLTMAVPAGVEYIDKGFHIAALNKYLDFMNILSYDYHSAFEPAVNHHSPLYSLEEDDEYNFDAQLTIDHTVNHYMKAGADRSKLVLGIPTYGRSYTLFNPVATELGSPADGPGEQGDSTREKGYLAYYEICENLKSDDWKVVHPNPKAMGPYAYKGDQWVSYDDVDIIKKKAQYVNDNELGGIMFWAIDNDDFRGKCHGRPYPLIEAGKEAMLKGVKRSNNEIEGTAPVNSGRTSPKRNRSRSKARSRGRARASPRPASTTSTTTTTTTTTASTAAAPPPTTPSYLTPEPPTTPDPGSDFKCVDEGFFPHPRDCKKYFWCLDSGPSNLGIVAHQFTCPSGLFFNKEADSCDYARNVVCNKKSKSPAGPSSTLPPIKAATSSTTRFSTSPSTIITTKTTSTTTTTEAPVAEIDEDQIDDEDDYTEYDSDSEEDPQALKELINLIKKLGGVEQLEKQLNLQNSDGNGDKEGTVTTPAVSRTLYNRIVSYNTARNLGSAARATTPSYTSSFQNRPERPQNAGLEKNEETQIFRKEKPTYVTIRRERPSTSVPPTDGSDEEEDKKILTSSEEEDNVEEDDEDYVYEDDSPETKTDAKLPFKEYITIQRSRSTTPSTEVTRESGFRQDSYSDEENPSSVNTATNTSPRYVTISRVRSTTESNTINFQDNRNRDVSAQISSDDDATEQIQRRPHTTTAFLPTENTETDDSRGGIRKNRIQPYTKNVDSLTVSSRPIFELVDQNTETPESSFDGNIPSSFDDSSHVSRGTTVGSTSKSPRQSQNTAALDIPSETATRGNRRRFRPKLETTSVVETTTEQLKEPRRKFNPRTETVTAGDPTERIRPRFRLKSETTTVNALTEQKNRLDTVTNPSTYEEVGTNSRYSSTKSLNTRVNLAENQKRFQTVTDVAVTEISERATDGGRYSDGKIVSEQETIVEPETQGHTSPSLATTPSSTSSSSPPTSYEDIVSTTYAANSKRGSNELSQTSGTVTNTTAAYEIGTNDSEATTAAYSSVEKPTEFTRLGTSSVSTIQYSSKDYGLPVLTTSQLLLETGIAEVTSSQVISTTQSVAHSSNAHTETSTENISETAASSSAEPATSPVRGTGRRRGNSKVVRRRKFGSPGRNSTGVGVTENGPRARKFNFPRRRVLVNETADKDMDLLESMDHLARDKPGLDNLLLSTQISATVPEASLKTTFPVENRKSKFFTSGRTTLASLAARRATLSLSTTTAEPAFTRDDEKATTIHLKEHEVRSTLPPTEPDDTALESSDFLDSGPRTIFPQESGIIHPVSDINLSSYPVGFKNQEPTRAGTTEQSRGSVTYKSNLKEAKSADNLGSVEDATVSGLPVVFSQADGTQSTDSPLDSNSGTTKSNYFTSEKPQNKNLFRSRSRSRGTHPPRSQASPEAVTKQAVAAVPRRGSRVSTTRKVTPTRPEAKAFSKVNPSHSQVTLDYEYYDDDQSAILDVAPLSEKVKIHSDGYIECLDQGNFPHPFSCKKFISCAKMENSELLGWEYTCPRQLSFDPIGGICNWSAGLGCKE